jgi:hypothetical protein
LPWIKPTVHLHGQVLQGCQHGTSVVTRNPLTGLELQVSLTGNIKSRGGDMVKPTALFTDTRFQAPQSVTDSHDISR